VEELRALFPGYGDPESAGVWADAQRRFPLGSHVRGAIVAVDEFGQAILDIGLGFPAVSQLAAADTGVTNDIATVGKEFDARIIMWANSHRRIVVSLMEPASPCWDAEDRRDLIAHGLIIAFVIAIADGSWIGAGIWLVGTITLAWFGMPAIEPFVGRLMERQNSFVLSTALAWAWYVGLVGGGYAGVFSPTFINLPVSSLEGGLIGLVIGPILAAILGAITAGLFSMGYRLVTGKWEF